MKYFFPLSLLKNLFVMLFVLNTNAVLAQHEGHDHKEGEHKTEHHAEGGHHKEAFDPGKMIMHHIADAHEWHFATIGEGKNATHISLPLPIILYTEKGLDIFLSTEVYKHENEGHYKKGDGTEVHTFNVKRASGVEYVLQNEKFNIKGGGFILDFSITKNVASLFISVILLLYVFFNVAKGYKTNAGKAPKGMQSFFEPIVEFIRDDIAKKNIGEKHYAKFMPYLLTIFFFIWFNNLLGLLPGGANLTGNIAVTLMLAGCTFLITTFSGNKYYWGHIFAPPVPPLLWIILIPIEIVGLFVKPFSLMIRLFANITAGHIMILSLFSLIFYFQAWQVGIVSVLFAVAMNCLELFVAILQAYVFTLLSSMYFGSAVEEHHHEEHHH
jgi:F-type H+-transporting ATPase subunit a